MATPIYEWNGELRAIYDVSQPEQPPHEVLQQAARNALVEAGRNKVATWNEAPDGPKYAFYDIELTGMEGEWGHSHHDPVTGINSWSGGGTGVGKLLYTKSETTSVAAKTWHGKKPA